MIEITASRLSIFPTRYRVSFEGEARVLVILLQLLKVGKQWNTTAKTELADGNINEVLKQIEKGV